MKFSKAETMLNHYLICNFFLNGWKQVVNEDMIETVFDQIETRFDAIAMEQGPYQFDHTLYGFGLRYPTTMKPRQGKI